MKSVAASVTFLNKVVTSFFLKMLLQIKFKKCIKCHKCAFKSVATFGTTEKIKEPLIKQNTNLIGFVIQQTFERYPISYLTINFGLDTLSEVLLRIANTCIHGLVKQHMLLSGSLANLNIRNKNILISHKHKLIPQLTHIHKE